MQPLRIDVTDETSVREAIEYTADTFGRLDALINCAGISKIAPLCDMDDWQDIIDVNLCGTIRMCKSASPSAYQVAGLHNQRLVGVGRMRSLVRDGILRY